MVFIFSCSKDDEIQSSKETVETVFTLPVVVHIGEEVGTGYNLSRERITGQIETLNNDFRKKEGTLGYNMHLLGTGAEIALTQKYMDYTTHACMNMFTKDQVERIRYVFKKSDTRKLLTISSAINRD